jgi:hypothetical protein
MQGLYMIADTRAKSVHDARASRFLNDSNHLQVLSRQQGHTSSRSFVADCSPPFLPLPIPQTLARDSEGLLSGRLRQVTSRRWQSCVFGSEGRKANDSVSLRSSLLQAETL